MLKYDDLYKSAVKSIQSIDLAVNKIFLFIFPRWFNGLLY